MDIVKIKQQQLDQLYEPYKKANNNCLLYCSGHTNIVFGEGNPNADIMFIGEAPGKDEDLQGRPFIGRSGKLLNKALEQAHIKREDVFVTNIVKCRPPNNKTPIIEQINECTFNLLRNQIKIIQPTIICTLGSIAAQVILKNKELKITKARGSLVSKGNFFIIPIYHPAYVLRNKSAEFQWFEDLKMINYALTKIQKESFSNINSK